MKFKKILIVIMAALLIFTMAACGGGKDNGKKHNGNNSGTKAPKIIPDLVDYSTDARYYNVADTSSSYGGAAAQKSLLLERQNKQKAEKDFDDMSVPVKIFTEAVPDDIIARMGKAGLTKKKMEDTVAYLAGNESESLDLEAIVATYTWNRGEGWSFFDDLDYLDLLQEEADNDGSASKTVKDRNDDNVQRQRRKIMGKVFAIGLTGDEFARLVVQEMLYAQSVVEDMRMKYSAVSDFDQYTKENLDYDTLVYFNAFNDFDANGIILTSPNQNFDAVGTNRRQTIKLYGYYYDYNKKMYDTLSEEEFEKELMYSHRETFTDAEYLEYLALQRKSYEGGYRYSYTFYNSFFGVHLTFQGKIEQYDKSVYQIGAAIENDSTLTYSGQMQKATTAGFAQQLVLSDTLFHYSQLEPEMKAYNKANTNYVNAKNGGAVQKEKDEYEWALNMEKMKAVDYIMTNMKATELTGVLKYQIYSYSADMIQNIQSEQKNNVLERLELDKLEPANPSHATAIAAQQEVIGRNDAMIAQIRRSYGAANIEGQNTTASSTNWAGMHTEVKTVLSHDYSKYKDGSAKLEAFEDLVIKKKTITDPNEDSEGASGINTREEYDTDHNISRFLSNHEDVLRYAIGQVIVELAARPTGSAQNSPYKINQAGSFTVGATGNITSEMLAQVAYGEPFDSITFEKGLSLTEGEDEAGVVNFLASGQTSVQITNKLTVGGVSGTNYELTYTFADWFIDMELKYKVRPGDEVKYNMVLYPGYNVTSVVK